jgi:catechol 2,3-dioxygenase
MVTRTIAVRRNKELGFKTTGYWMGAIFMACGDYHHHIAFNNWPLPQPKEGTGLLELRMLSLHGKRIDPLGVELIGELSFLLKN